MDAWVQQFTAAYKLWRTIGNDHMTLGLWYSRIPTLFEYNQFSSPVFHALIKRTLQRPALPHERNITILSHANARVLKLLGVRYAILPQDDSPLGPRRAAQNVDGQQWGLFELSDVNLATYSPTSIEVRGSLASTLAFVADEGIDLAKSAVVREEMGGVLVPAQSASLSMSGGDLHVTARSTGRSLLIVPLEFSHCIDVAERGAGPGGAGPTLVRVDGTPDRCHVRARPRCRPRISHGTVAQSDLPMAGLLRKCGPCSASCRQVETTVLTPKIDAFAPSDAMSTQRRSLCVRVRRRAGGVWCAY